MGKANWSTNILMATFRAFYFEVDMWILGFVLRSLKRG
jgi:hypothetical protein